jgi:hypothetical protein
MRHTPVIALFAFLLLGAAHAADPKPANGNAFQPLPEPPPMPAGTPGSAAPAEDSLEPEVTITTRGDTRHEEYRIRGQLYMIKVIPAHGKPYYLIDREGRGEFTRSATAPDVAVPMWVIKRF